MYTVDQIKEQAEVSTIYPDANPQGIPGFVHWTGEQAIWCFAVEGGYVWTVNGERARESEVRNALSARQQ